MDKYEYKVRAEEIKSLIEKKDYAQAAEIADTIDWRRVKSVMMLCTISDLYKINRRYEDARDMLLLAYERRPGGRNICYSLCELSIKTGEFVQAMEYYKEFVQVAPRDPGRYILQYKLYEDQDVSLEERIEVLEELKKHDYREKWAYELAYLYHRVGLATRCVEECDEMILWFGDGDYVIKAMELKMLHQPLSAEQQEKYDHRFDAVQEQQEEGTSVEATEEVETGAAESSVLSDKTREFGVKAIEEAVGGDTRVFEPIRLGNEAEDSAEADYYPGDEEAYSEEQEAAYPSEEDGAYASEEFDIQVKTIDVGQYNTINLQAELAQGLKELLDNEMNAVKEAEQVSVQEDQPEQLMQDTESLDSPEIEEVDAEDLEPEPENMESSEVFFGETGEIEFERVRQDDMTVEELAAVVPKEEEEVSKPAIDSAQTLLQAGMSIEHVEPVKVTGMTARMTVIEPPKNMANVLIQESDGQIGLAVPEEQKTPESQITGQMNIEDILAEWERWKKQNEEKHKEEVRQRVLAQTGNMFTEFEASVRDGLLEQLEKSADAAFDSEITDEEAYAAVYGISEDTEEKLEEGLTGETSIEDALAAVDGMSDAQDGIAGENMSDVISEDDEVEEIEEVLEGEALEEAEDAAEEAEETEAAAEEADAEAEEAEDAAAEADVETAEEAEETEAAAEEADTEAEGADEADPEAKEIAEKPHNNSSERVMSKEEQEIYKDYIHHRSTEEQILKAVDSMSLAAYTGNVIITGEFGIDTIGLAKKMIREIQTADSNFSGKVAKISGKGMNQKNVAETIAQLQNGALIIQNACDMDEKTVKAIYKALENENIGIILILSDDTKVMNRYLKDHKFLLSAFPARVDVKALTNDMLVAYGKEYAKEQEYAVDELGLLALHTCIENRQTMEHAVTTSEVEELVDKAIKHANRKTVGHFFSILFAKRYDEEDMIILTEKDFD